MAYVVYTSSHRKYLPPTPIPPPSPTHRLVVIAVAGRRRDRHTPHQTAIAAAEILSSCFSFGHGPSRPPIASRSAPFATSTSFSNMSRATPPVPPALYALFLPVHICMHVCLLAIPLVYGTVAVRGCQCLLTSLLLNRSSSSLFYFCGFGSLFGFLSLFDVAVYLCGIGIDSDFAGLRESCPATYLHLSLL
ncbi:hypothetical protein C8Q70DRAFT_163202 [Cubamyces menziesii]|nr:hypothetical protein C8Q70DRAFT_163202 [Cubamyces menziesii]